MFLTGAYLLAGIFWVPGLIRTQATLWVKTNLDKPIAIGEIRFNPVTFTLDISELAIPDRDHPMVAVGHLRVGFSILSLFQSAYRFDQVRIDQPFVRALVRPDGALNLIELVPKTHSEGPNPVVRIANFEVNQGKIVYADNSLAARPEKILAPITFALKDFQTNQAEGGAFTLKAKGDRGEGFDWTGKISIAPIFSQGRLVVAGLQSDTIQKFLGEELPVVLTGGAVGFSANYSFAYGKDGVRLDMAVPDLALSGVAFDGKKEMFRGSVKIDRLNASLGPIIAANGSGGIARLDAAMPRLDVQGISVSGPAPDQAIKLTSFALKNARLDYGARRIDLGDIALNGADLPIRRERDGKISLLAMLPEKPAGPAAATAVQASAQASAQPWNIRLGSFALIAAALRFEDRAVTPAARFTVTPLNLTVTGSGSDLSQPVNVHFDARINDGATAMADGTVTPADGIADLKFTLAALPLRAFISYMPRYPDLDLRSGNLGASGTLHLLGGDVSALRFQGDAAVANLSVYEIATKSPLVSWQAFALKSIDYRTGRLEIGGGRLTRPFGRIAVLPNRTFNFMSFMPAGAAPAEIPPTGQSAGPAPKAKAAAVPAVSVRIKRIDIDQGTMSFADYSMQPSFEARIDALQGAISNISNLPHQVAAIDFTGQVIDRFSPVTIKGSMDPFGYDQRTDIHLAFRNIELPVFNPYSGRYAGYAISKGKLTTDFDYKIDKRALKADHHIVIDQLEWGAATDSKDKVPLPIRLATALLKDKDGVIDLDVPVSGSLDDPQFRLGPIIWQIIGNLLEKAVTAPFRLIGALFAGAEKAQFVDFTPGAGVLPPGSPEALGAFAKALAERPELSLDIPAGPATAEDATDMADHEIDAALMAKEIKKGRPADFAALDLDEQHDRFADLYKARLGKKPVFPDFPPDALKAGASAKPPLDEDDQRTVLETQWLRTQLRPVFAPSGAQLAALGLARATAVRDALLADKGVDPARVFMEGSLTATASDGHSRLELKLK